MHPTALALAALLVPSAFAAPTIPNTQAESRAFPPLPSHFDHKTAPEPSRAPDVLATRPAPSAEAQVAPSERRSKSIDPRAPISRAGGLDRTRAHFDAPGDGSLWVRGTNYKLAFDESGATYYPLFGARQQRHLPLALSPATLEIGGVASVFERDAVAVQSGNRVEIDRGAFVEAYDCGPTSIEQTFVFPSLPRDGDLVLTIPTSGEAAGAECEEDLEFRSEHGRVSYSRAIAIDATGRRTAAATTLGAGTITIHVEAAFLATAALPLVIDPVVSTHSIDTSSFDNFLADVAYDATFDRWLVVYEEYPGGGDLDVYYVMLNGAGAYLWGGYINSNNAEWRSARCANLNSADQFLVASAVGNPGDMRIRGRTVQAGLSSLSGEFFISGSGESGWMAEVSVGGDPFPTGPAAYCVAYERIYGVGDNDVLVRLVHPDGSSNPTIFLSNSGGTLDGQIEVSKSNGGSIWTIVWMRAGSVDGDIWAGRIRYNGQIVNGPFQLTSGSLDWVPSVSSPLEGSERNLVVFQRNYGTDYDIQGIVLDGATAVAWSNLTILENVAVFQNQINPFVDSDGRHFLFGYAERYSTSAVDYDIYVADVRLSGNTLSVAQAHQNLAYTSYREDNVRVASAAGSGGASRRYFAVWDKELNATSHDVLGALFDGYEGGTSTPICFGDGSGAACPCGNFGAPGNGCASSVNPAGARLAVSGSHSTVAGATHLTATGLPATTVCLFYQGLNATGGSAFGDGLNCISGSVIRLGTRTAAGGIAAYPGPGDPSIVVRGNVPLNGGARTYQAWYRNSASFCTVATFNLSNGVRIDWAR